MFFDENFRSQPKTVISIHDDYHDDSDIDDLQAYYRHILQQQRQGMLEAQRHLKLPQNDNNKNNSNNNSYPTIPPRRIPRPNPALHLSTLILPSQFSHCPGLAPASEEEEKENPYEQALKLPACRTRKRSKSLDVTINPNNENNNNNAGNRGDDQDASRGSINSLLITNCKSHLPYSPKQVSKQPPSANKPKKHLNKSLPPLPSLSPISLKQCQKNYEISQYLNAASDPSAYTTKPLRVSTMLETPIFSVDRDLASHAHSLPLTSGQHFNKSPIITTTIFTDTNVASPTSPAPVPLSIPEVLQQQQQTLTSPPTNNISYSTTDVDACSEPPAIPPRSASRGRKYYSKYLEYDLSIKPGNILTTATNTTPSSYYEPNYSYRDSMSAQSRNSNFSGCYQRSGSGRSRYSRKKSLSFESRRSLESLLNAHDTAATTAPSNSNNTNSTFTCQNANATTTSTSISYYTPNNPIQYLHDTKTDIRPLPLSSSESSTNLFNSRKLIGIHNKKNSTSVHHNRNSSLLRNFINEDLSFLDDSMPVDLIPPFAPLGRSLLVEEDTNSGYSSSIYSSPSTPSLSRSVSNADSEKEKPKEEPPQKQQQQHEKKIKEKTSRLNLLTRFIYRKKTVVSDVC
jgi:hypothetical protein